MKQIINLTPTNDAWLTSKVKNGEYASKAELIQCAREQEGKHNKLKQAIDYGLFSGSSDKTPEDIRRGVIERLKKKGKLQA